MKEDAFASLGSPLPALYPQNRPTCPQRQAPQGHLSRPSPRCPQQARPTSPEPPPSHRMEAPFSLQLEGFLGSPRSQAPQPSPPLPPLYPRHHTKGALHPSLQPRVVLPVPQRPSPRSPAFPKGWGAGSFPLSLVSLRGDKERVGGGNEDRILVTPTAGRYS